MTSPSQPHPARSRTILVIGAGIIGSACAWHLRRCGHEVLLLEPGRPGDIAGKGGNASHAALGLLMAQTFRRSGGRAWRLRQHGLRLWLEWRLELRHRGHDIPWRPGLLVLASDAGEMERQRRLVSERHAMGLPLEIWERERLETLAPPLPKEVPGGLHSPADGQLDPGQAIAALWADAIASGVRVIHGTAEAIERAGTGTRRWRVPLCQGGSLEADTVVVAAGVNGSDLVAGMGAERTVEPVLGQAVELELAEEDLQASPSWWNWPGAVAWHGINLVPRPDLPGGRRLWLGATLEHGRVADPAEMESLQNLHGAAPAWLQRARQIRRWQGLRPRPVGRPAPLLEEIAPGLLLAGGHYRNGVLLAPASAEWVSARIEAAD